LLQSAYIFIYHPSLLVSDPSLLVSDHLPSDSLLLPQTTPRIAKEGATLMVSQLEFLSQVDTVIYTRDQRDYGGDLLNYPSTDLVYLLVLLRQK